MKKDDQLQPLAYTLDQVGEVLQISGRQVRRLVQRGEITVVYLSPQCPRVTNQELERFLESKNGGSDE